MELVYKNKKTIEEILKKSDSMKKQLNIDETKSMLFKGDNFCVMSSLMQDFKGKIDLIYTDPPYNTAQDFFVSENRANSISKTKNGKQAYSDKMSEDEYIEFIRERLVLMRELLSDRGSLYIHIGCGYGYHVKLAADEIFGEENFKNDIIRIKSNPKNFFRRAYGNEKDLILFYSKNSGMNIWNDIKIPLGTEEMKKRFPKTDANGRRYTTIPLHAPGETINGITGKPWRNIPVPAGRHWRTDPAEFDILDERGDIEWSSTGNPRIKKYADEHQGKKIQDIWNFKDPQYPRYPTEKNTDMIKQIILQSSNENSIVMDCFAGSGSALKAANNLGRKWIGIDNSEIAVKIIKENDIGDYNYYDIDNYGGKKMSK